MPIVRFIGSVHPKASQLRVTNLPTIRFHEPPFPPALPTGLDIEYKTSIEDGVIIIECDVQQWPPDFSWIFNRVHMTAYSLIDLFSFATGVPHELVFERFIDPNGEEKQLLIQDQRLSALCTFTKFQGGFINLGKALELVIQYPDLYQSLRDLIRGISHPNFAVIDCARAIEGLRYIFEPNTDKRGAGWGKLQNALNVSQSYREYVTGTSTKPRHGHKGYIEGAIVNEVIQRAWKIMNRFIEYKLRGDYLPLSEFEML